METKELNAKVRRLKRLAKTEKGIEDEIDGIKTEIKQYMQEQGVEELEGKDWTVRFINVTTNRFDVEAFKAANKGVYEIYLKETVNKRFTVS